MTAIELQIDRVSKAFRTGRGQIGALQDISLEVAEGELVCLVGPSGCGKSTLLSVVAGLEPPDAGQVILDGQPVQGPGPERILIFQDGGLFPWLTVLENVTFGLRERGLPLEERRQRAMEVLRLVHLERFKDAYIHELSGGMRQRVAIARGLVLSPRILLMDEPFAALDTQTRDLLVEELRGLHEELKNTILFVTHHVREAVYLADRVVLFTFQPGRIKHIYPLEVPRPRDPDDPSLEALVREIVEALHVEVERALNEEYRRA
ncbi:MAG: ABC transporter ATP-binding protein [Elusimicrobia bacterium]|nr:ABC transporter ATP-binding protein [Elusimicrobiota bacterium]